MATLYLIRGRSGVGKSSLAKRLGIGNHFEADMWWALYNGGKFEASKLPLAHSWCQSSVRAALERGDDVVVANTFIRQWEMKPYREMADALKVNLVEIIVNSSPFNNVHGVPKWKVEQMQRDFEYQ